VATGEGRSFRKTLDNGYVEQRPQTNHQADGDRLYETIVAKYDRIPRVEGRSRQTQKYGVGSRVQDRRLSPVSCKEKGL